MNYNVIFASILFITASVTPTCTQTKNPWKKKGKILFHSIITQ